MEGVLGMENSYSETHGLSCMLVFLKCPPPPVPAMAPLRLPSVTTRPQRTRFRSFDFAGVGHGMKGAQNRTGVSNYLLFDRQRSMAYPACRYLAKKPFFCTYLGWPRRAFRVPPRGLIALDFSHSSSHEHAEFAQVLVGGIGRARTTKTHGLYPI